MADAVPRRQGVTGGGLLPRGRLVGMAAGHVPGVWPETNL